MVVRSAVMMAGDEQKKTYLREALARGCDEAVFLKLDAADDSGICQADCKVRSAENII